LFPPPRSLPSAIEPYAGDVCIFLFRALEDGFHDIKKAACACICSLMASRLPPGAIEPHAEKLLQVCPVQRGGTDCLKWNIHEQSSMSGEIACIREFATFVVFFASRLCFPTLVTRTRGCVWS